MIALIILTPIYESARRVSLLQCNWSSQNIRKQKNQIGCMMLKVIACMVHKWSGFPVQQIDYLVGMNRCFYLFTLTALCEISEELTQKRKTSNDSVKILYLFIQSTILLARGFSLLQLWKADLTSKIRFLLVAWSESAAEVI